MILPLYRNHLEQQIPVKTKSHIVGLTFLMEEFYIRIQRGEDLSTTAPPKKMGKIVGVCGKKRCLCASA
jgi:uncharacterized protein (DUF2237 family)